MPDLTDQILADPDVQASLANQTGSETDVAVPLSALPRKYRKYLTGYEQVTQ